MLVIRKVDPSDAAEFFGESPPLVGMTPTQSAALCRRRGLVAFAVEENGWPAGFSIAHSGPRGVHIIGLEGRPDACRFLLKRLVRLAGERDLSAWCPAARKDVQGVLDRQGFVRECGGVFQGLPSFLYRLRRNEALA